MAEPIINNQRSLVAYGLQFSTEKVNVKQQGKEEKMHIGKKNLRFSADQYVAILSAYNTTNVSVFFKILEYQ